MSKFIDLTGKKFGKLTVICLTDPTDKKKWDCKCECGRTVNVFGSNLRRGLSTECKWCAKAQDLTGQKFGRLTAVKRVPITKNGIKKTYYQCKCDCGGEVTTLGVSLTGGYCKSCGCISKELAKSNIAGWNKSHGESRTRLYYVWLGIKRRIYNPHTKKYPIYGGRGIKMCDEWSNSYEAFRDWALVNGYDPKAKYGDCTIDRIDVDGDYCPENCRWVNMKVQAQNKRSKHGTEIYANAEY